MACVSRHPVRYHVALETKLFLQDSIQQLAILAAVRAIESTIQDQD